MFDNSIEYPFNGPDSTGNILVGGLAIALSLLILPLFFVYGYYFRVYERTFDGEEEPPRVNEDVGKMFADGLRYFGVTMIYFAVPFGIIAAFFALDQLVAGFLIATVFYFVAMYALPAAVMSVADKGSFAAAFDTSHLTEVITEMTYVRVWLAVLAVSIPFGIITTIVSTFIPFIGFILVAFLSFIFGVFVHNYYARAYREIAGMDENGEESEEQIETEADDF